jgi:hypothetical protein
MKRTTNYDNEVLGSVAYEFSALDRAESERKIKRRLRDKKLGPFDLERVERLRALKVDVKREIDQTSRSQFFLRQNKKYVDYSDWDIEGMKNFMEERHSEIEASTIENFVPFAILIYYLK